MRTDGKDNVLYGSSVIKKSCIQMAVHSSWNEGRNFIHIDDNVHPATNGCRSSSNCFILDSRAFLCDCKLVQ